MNMSQRRRGMLVVLSLLISVLVIPQRQSSAWAQNVVTSAGNQEIIIGLSDFGLAQSDMTTLSKSNAGPARLTALLQTYGLQDVRALYTPELFAMDDAARADGLAGTIVVTVPQSVEPMQLVTAVERLAEVAYAEPNFRVTLLEKTGEADGDGANDTNIDAAAVGGRAVNGQDVGPSDFLWAAQIRMSSNNRLICGGVIINRYWVLTAAQCVTNRTAAMMYVRAGAREVDAASGIQDKSIRKIFRHPAYSAATNQNNLVLLQLQNPIAKSATAQPEVIGHRAADARAYEAGSKTTMVGWGMTQVATDGLAGYLRKSTSTIIAGPTCKTALGSKYRGGMLCADTLVDGDPTTALCGSDLGSGLLATINGRQRIVGLAIDSLSCGDGTPSVYTNLSGYWSWIYSIVKMDVTDDPFIGMQWGLNNGADTDVDALEAWGITRGVDTTMVAVVDTGIKLDHPDLESARLRTDIDYDFANSDTNASDDNGHGTHVAGIIGATADNGIGVTGVCPGCELLPVKVLKSDGGGNADNVAQGIRYAADRGADVINMSLGIDPNCGCSKTIANAINYAYNKGSFLVAAAGNNGKGTLSYPSASSRVLPVIATTILGRRASFSNFGPGAELAAPGDNIFSTYTSPEYKQLDGTSMASPLVAGIAGLALSRRAGLTNPQLYWLLRNSTDDMGEPGYDQQTGFGRINAYEAVSKDIGGVVDKGPDGCNSEPSSGCGNCSTSLVLGTEAKNGSQALLYQFRDSVLKPSVVGARWTSLFYTHNVEMGYLILMNPTLRTTAYDMVMHMQPAIRTLLGAGDTSTVFTDQDFRLISAFRSQLLADASPRLRTAVNDEWSRIQPQQFVGKKVTEIWKSLQN